MLKNEAETVGLTSRAKLWFYWAAPRGKPVVRPSLPSATARQSCHNKYIFFTSHVSSENKEYILLHKKDYTVIYIDYGIYLTPFCLMLIITCRQM